MQGMTWIMFAMGFVCVLYVMFAWWSEVVKESQIGDHTPVVRIGLRYGFIMFIMSEIMFFAAWFWSFFKHALYPMDPGGMSPAVDGVWPPVGIETFDPWHLPLINTLILLCSGCAATWAHHAIVHDNDRKGLVWGLALAIALGRAREKFDIRQQLKAYTTDLEKKVEDATRELRRRSNFQINLIRSSNDGIIATDKDLKIVIYNPVAKALVG